MSARTYDIVRWDGIIQSSSTPQPGMYIVPDSTLIEFLNNMDQVAIKISETNSGYDNMLTYAHVIPSEYAGGYRPNYQAETQSYVVLPQIVWNGYPPNLGKITFLDFAETSVESFRYAPHNDAGVVPSYTRHSPQIVLVACLMISAALYYYNRNAKR
jgi:hypothetical protein